MEKWISNVHPHQGKIHREFNVPTGQRITTATLQEIKNAPIGSILYGATVTPKLKRRAILALTMR